MLDLRGRPVVVVGGGSVGLRKAASLRAAGARVKLVAEHIDADADLAGMDVTPGSYRRELLDGAMLVFACTDDREVNGCVARDARSAGALVNVADTPDECDFYLSASVGDGEVVVAVSTGGAAPAVAAWLKQRLAAALPERVGDFVAVLEGLRDEIRSAVADGAARMAVMKQLASDETHQAFLRGGADAVRARFAELLKQC